MSFTGCQPTLIAEFSDRPVVECYFYADHVPTVKITKLIPFRSDVVFSEEDVDRIAVTITDDTTGESCILTAQGEGIYTTASNFKAKVGHTYTMTIPYNGELVAATTTIPPKPVNMALSETSITAMGSPMGRAGGPGGGVEITWDNAGKDYYMLAVENTMANPEPIFEDDGEEEWPRPAFRVEPTQGTSTQLSQMSFYYYGMHDVILIRMQPEYVLLYSTNGTTSSTLTEIHANVENGYGIFTGVNADTMQLKVIKYSSASGRAKERDFLQ